MIVKVQLAIPKKDTVLVYSKGKKYVYQGAADKQLINILNNWGQDGGYKGFFHATLIKDKRPGGTIKFMLDKPAKEQSW